MYSDSEWKLAMMSNQNFLILLVLAGCAVFQVGCVAAGRDRGQNEPRSIESTIDESVESENGNNQNLTVFQPPQDVMIPDLQQNENTASSVTSPTCPFAPTTMRIHPLTRIILASDHLDKMQIDLRIELDDRFGDTTKGIGSIRIRLFPRLAENENGNPDIRLALWKPEFQDIEANAAHFDHITRTYHFLLNVPRGNAVPAQSTIVITLTTDTGVLHAPRDLQFSPTK